MNDRECLGILAMDEFNKINDKLDNKDYSLARSYIVDMRERLKVYQERFKPIDLLLYEVVYNKVNSLYKQEVLE